MYKLVKLRDKYSASNNGIFPDIDKIEALRMI